MRPSRIFFLAETPILTITLGLLAWALHVLAQSIQLSNASDNFGYFPADTLYTYTLIQAVTGYSTSSISSASVKTLQPSAYTVIGLNGQRTPHTNSGNTYTIGPYTYGLYPTGTKTRTITVSGIQEISHLQSSKNVINAAFSPTLTPAPSLTTIKKKKKTTLLARQTFAAATTTITTSSHPRTRLNTLDFWSLSQIATPPAYVQYQSVSVNRGFHGNFQEVGIDYIYNRNDLDYPQKSNISRLRALVAFAAIALISIVIRLVCTTILSLIREKQEVETSHTKKDKNNLVVRKPSSLDDKKAFIFLVWFNNLVFTILLLLTYFAFWVIYGVWTHRNGAVEEADLQFHSDPALIATSLSNLLHTVPWKGKPTALIVFWTLTLLTSIADCSLSFRSMRQRRHSSIKGVL